MLQRTYRSKKDMGGGLDPKEMLSNMDDKDSVFNAFYIQNIKQTKREQSCMSASNSKVAGANKVRKRRFAKRIIKQVEHPPKESLSRSVFLTPDKSIRVNKAPDPFDLLLNSSPAMPEVKLTKKEDLFDKVLATTPKQTKCYARKKKTAAKKFNYSSSNSSVSDKENNVNGQNNLSQNVTDIGSHELVVEKEAKPSPQIDESINNIVKKLTLINNMKNRSSESLKKTFTCNKNRLTRNLPSPILKTSPLSSTPFTEKCRSKSIYKFSPIPMGDLEESPNYVTITEDDNEVDKSIVFIPKCKSNSLKRTPIEDFTTPVTHLSKDIVSKHQGNSKPLFSSENETQEDSKKSETNNKTESHKTNELSSIQTSEMEPFLGFNIDKVDNESSIEENREHSIIIPTGKMPRNYNKSKECIKSLIDASHPNENSFNPKINSISSIEYTVPKEPFLGFTEQNSGKNVSTNEEPVINALLDDLENTNTEPVIEHSSGREVLETSNITEADQQSISSSSDDLADNSGYKNVETVFEHDSKQEESETSDSEADPQSIKDATQNTRYSLYDTCISEHDSSESELQSEPIVALERMDMDLFNNKASPCPSSASEDTAENEDGISEDYSSLNDLSEKKDQQNMSSNPESDVTYTQSESESNEETNSSEEDVTMFQHRKSNENGITNYVTTRRRHDFTNISTISVLDDSTESSSENEKTVLSNKINVSPKRDLNITAINVDSEIAATIMNKDDENETSVTENSNHIKPISTEERISNITIRNSRLFDDRKMNFDLDALNITAVNVDSEIRKDNENETSDTENSNQLKPIPAEERISNITIRNSKLFDNRKIENPYHEKPISPEARNITVRNSKLFDDRKVNFDLDASKSPETKPIILQPGKKWERSLSIYRRMTMATDQFNHSILEDEDLQTKGRKYRMSVITTMEMQEQSSLHNESFHSRRSTFIPKPSRSTIRIVKENCNPRLSLSSSTVFDDLKGFLEDCDDTIVELSKLSLADDHEVTVVDKFNEDCRIATARDYVLRRCNQTDTIPFDECYPDSLLKNCRKIGEGVYGEVFLWRAPDGRARVMKVVPIAGHVKVNGEQQKHFHEIIAEIVIAMELSALRAPIASIECHLEEGKDISELDLHSVENATDVFNEVLAVRCVYGVYPSRLLDLWELYDECRGSENDNPAVLPVDQQYIVLELANAGQDLESFQFNSAEQAYALFLQVAFALAVGEEAFQFEHRDLHWGNVLIAPTDQKYATFVIRGRAHRVLRRGVAATIIDYSLSRVSLPLGGSGGVGGAGSGGGARIEAAALYNDLATDDGLFAAVGDYQFEVYRLMRDKLGNDWKNFEPYTNILWLHYTVDKMITALRYKRPTTKTHKQYINKLKAIKQRILNYHSAAQFVLTDNEY